MNRKLVTLLMLLANSGAIFASDDAVKRQDLITKASAFSFTRQSRKSRAELFKTYAEEDPSCCQSLVMKSLSVGCDARNVRYGCALVAVPLALAGQLHPVIRYGCMGCALTEGSLIIGGCETLSAKANRALYEYVTTEAPRAPESMKED